MTINPQLSFQALVASSPETGEIQTALQQLSLAELSPGEVTIRVHYSSVNYKDALAISPNNAVVKQYPLVPGIDLAGIVLASEDPRFTNGDKVIVTGYGLGTSHSGGFSELARVPADWVTRLPAALTLQEAMMLGTAGLTAALSLYQLELNGLTAVQGGQVLVTGASGGVGTLAIGILARAGYTVTAVTGKADAHDRLARLGARQVIDRAELLGSSSASPPALGKQRWAGAIDPVGGPALAAIVSSLQYGASVAVSGLTGGASFSSTVFPFILRGANVLGIDSVYCPAPLRELLWERLAAVWKPAQLSQGCYEISLEQVPEVSRELLAGTHKGRAVVKL
ncbi:oxidoreductase [Paenibacillus sp. GCM10027626]|uniref:oxidoreductase n=1 Tax=Paenibacillus sp. GCM10027626 TaxID=3273411 RepID=UPI00363E4763